jgi:hypothetical protein
MDRSWFASFGCIVFSVSIGFCRAGKTPVESPYRGFTVGGGWEL